MNLLAQNPCALIAAGLEALSLYRLPPFRYIPLEPDQIRLLRIQPGISSSPVHCMTYNIDQKAATTKYLALSYCWGSPTRFSRTIVLNNCRLSIQPNLYQALVALRRRDEVVELWADAICINQSNIDERNSQVAQMDQIYISASSVIIWLGEAGDESDYVMRSIANRDLEAFITPRFMFAIIRILKRPWFTRTWIVQEFVLNPKQPLLVCGSAPEVTINQFLEAYYAGYPMAANERFPPIAGIGTPSKSEQARSWSLLHHSLLTMLMSIRNGIQRHSPRGYYSLDHALFATRSFCATDPRDKIFGLLALTDVETRQKIQPNYDKTVEDVFQDVTRYFLINEASTSIYWIAPFGAGKTRNKTRDASVPSWVPDFSDASMQANPIPYGDPEGYAVVRTHSKELVRVTECGKKLHVRGVKLGFVASTIKAPIFMHNIPFYRSNRSRFAGIISWIIALFKFGNLMASMARFIVAIETSVQSTEAQHMELRPEPLWETLLAPMSSTEKFNDKNDCSQKFDKMLAAARNFSESRVGWPWWITWSRTAPLIAAVAAAKPVSEQMMLAFSSGRCFLSGRERWYGIGDGEMQGGDELVLLFPPANVPFVVRKKDKEAYEMVGLAHIPSVFRKESIAKDASQWEEFVIM
ncbi:heterokaryon incompatibility protein-domain-containing protein [Truncatella angustata]|uniref:Heterokaryon incompatibility protein-domain-containing protein n=1 Tax=Truncatella angustata TaxID=152316 RepID=A0A9P8ZYH4_9PEZI|nr:heterokaryon incompatibility protein-domain-containing protein [Truncatella angustata]KAH6656046.1 heterokaryon incompatibility protein-domain-containing protein [Truncatella angustata]